MLDSSHIEPDVVRPLRRAEYDRLVALGSFQNEKLELLRGVIIAMSPQGPKHAAVIQRLTMLLVPALVGRAEVRVQSPLAVSDDSEPEPDIAVVEPGDYHEGHPTCALLVIEVAESSQQKDRHIKPDLYAAAGVPEYWVVDLVERAVFVHRQSTDGRYHDVSKHAPGARVSCRALADLAVQVEDLLPYQR